MASDFVPVASGEPDVAAPRAGGLVSDVGVADGRPGALYVFRAGDAADLARALERMTDRAVLSRYNWKRDSAVLLEVVDSLARRRCGVPLGRRRA
jgi:hypothetical protein